MLYSLKPLLFLRQQRLARNVRSLPWLPPVLVFERKPFINGSLSLNSCSHAFGIGVFSG